MRINTTTLESFRLYMEPDQDWMTEADLLATIRGEFVPTREILIGRAFGHILETPDAFCAVRGYLAGGFVFSEEGIDRALALIDRPHTVFEAKAIRRYGSHDVVAKADQLVGGHLIETKTTFGYFQFDKYADSSQWKFMVDLFEALVVTYHIFSLDENKEGTIGVRAIDSFNVYPYTDLHEECADLVRRFEAYVSAKGLVPLLDQRQREAA